MKTTTLPLRNSMNRSPSGAFLLIALALGWLALAPQARAVCQEGCLVNGNTVLGDDALLNNIGSNNTAIGIQALFSNTTGAANTAIGINALFSNTTNHFNVAIGNAALYSNTGGNNNTANGVDALFSNTSGHNNTAIGFSALGHNRTGRRNIALGFEAGFNLSGDDNIDIGNVGVRNESNTIRIGTTGTQTNAFVAGISGATVPTGIAVIVDSSGHLGTTTSSARFKDAIKPMDKASEAILALKPVTFRYKHELDSKGIPQFGLVAEQVEKVNPDLVARDDQGKPYTVRYEAVNAMLLNEFLKEHKKVEQLQATVTQQQKDFQAAIATLKQTVTAQLNGQAAQIQKLSAQLELSKSVLQSIANNQ
jgi:Chaperone of endosialidase